MPSEKLKRILQARSAFSEADIDAMSEAAGWSWVYGNTAPRKAKPSAICFTGFTDADKRELMALAASVSISVVSSVNKSLLFLCTGDNPGPSKLAKARASGIPILTLDQFVKFLEDGALRAAGD